MDKATKTDSGPNGPNAVFDRWFFTGLAVLYSLVAIIGFGPKGYLVAVGEMANPPLSTHAHAVSMALWLVLLTVQAALMGNGKWTIHQKLGLTSLALAPVMVVLMLAVVLRTYDPANHGEAVAFIQARRLTLFTVCIGVALYLRFRDGGSHKRLFFIGTVVLLDAAINRMPWLPDFGIENVIVTHTYQLLLLIPLVIFDILKLGRPHKITMAGLLILAGTAVIGALLW